MGIDIRSGTHLFGNNVVEYHLQGGSPHQFHGAVYVEQGKVTFVHESIRENANTQGASWGVGLHVETGNVVGVWNELANNRGYGVSDPGSALYVGDASLSWRLGAFVDNTPLSTEIENVNVLPIDLSSNYFSGLESAPLTSRVRVPARVNLSDPLSEPPAEVGPRPCLVDADCEPLTGEQLCHFGGCVPACFLDPCSPTERCVPETGRCAP